MHIVIAGRHPVTRSAIKLLLQVRLGLDQIGEAATPTDLMAQVESGGVDLVLLDEDIWDQSPAQLVENLTMMPDPPVILALGGSSCARQDLLDAGAEAFLYKGDPPANLLIAVEFVRHRLDHAS